jgi:hypothetical protein
VLARLRAAPVTAPTLVAVAIFLVWIPLDGGQAITRWAPGAIAVIALLAVAAFALPGAWRERPPAVRAAVLALAAFTAWSFLSIAWADDQGAALQGADRTLLYLAVFALFALWPQQPVTAAWVLGLWTFGAGVLALVTLIRVGAVADPARLFADDRLIDPIGYPNAAAATWLMPFWPAVALAAGARVPWPARGAAAFFAVVLADLALLSQSRGSLLALPACALIFVAIVPGRLRHVAALVPIAGAAALALPAVLDVGDALDGTGGGVGAAADAAVRAVLIAAVAAGVTVLAVAAWEALRPPSPATAARLRRGWTAVLAAAAAVCAVAGLVAIGNPVDRVDSAWASFKGGYDDNTGSSSRLTAGLGSNRYDFYRVALDVFGEHPVAGAGADNFFQDYLARGHSEETPNYPHNVALRTLEQTGVVGALLLLAAWVAALVAAWRGMRAGRDPLAATVAGGATMAFIYWVAHGMTDWFWEWAGLGAPAFALLGLACALAPRAQAATERARPRPVALIAGGAALVVAALAIAGPWLAERDMERAGAVYAARPFEAYSRLDRAADLDPLSDRPALLAGSIALRYGDLRRARSAFTDALARNPRGQYATLELGAIASVQGDRARARSLLARAAALAPRDPTTREALDVVGGGGVVDIAALNARLLSKAQRITGG